MIRTTLVMKSRQNTLYLSQSIGPNGRPHAPVRSWILSCSFPRKKINKYNTVSGRCSNNLTSIIASETYLIHTKNKTEKLERKYQQIGKSKEHLHARSLLEPVCFQLHRFGFRRISPSRLPSPGSSPMRCRALNAFIFASSSAPLPALLHCPRRCLQCIGQEQYS